MLAADKVAFHEWEGTPYFDGCLPIEVMAERGPRTLAFGPMKPVGLTDPRTGRWPHAVVQLRSEDAAQTAYNMSRDGVNDRPQMQVDSAFWFWKMKLPPSRLST